MIELITQKIIEALNTPKDGQNFLWDSDLKGFGVRVGSTGVKSYVVQYRSPDGRLRRMAFARCNLFDVDEARQHARSLLAKATLGIDPADEKNAARRNGSVAEIWTCNGFAPVTYLTMLPWL
ncbi:MAG: Arm DNA-binding domain-containing protein, partial [Sphingobium sp.]